MYKSLRRHLSTWNSLFTIKAHKAKQASRPVQQLCQGRKADQASFPKDKGRFHGLKPQPRPPFSLGDPAVSAEGLKPQPRPPSSGGGEDPDVSADSLKPQPHPPSSPGDLDGPLSLRLQWEKQGLSRAPLFPCLFRPQGFLPSPQGTDSTAAPPLRLTHFPPR